MQAIKAHDNLSVTSPSLSDDEILALFHYDSERGWQLLIERYADAIYSQIHHLGFDYDQTMDRFVYVCEKLCEQQFRRLKTVQYTGQSGELVPWLRKVVKHLCINWAWSSEGRRRLFKCIARLPAVEQRIFELYFWKGLSPSAIHEQLRLEHHLDASLIEVLDSLERIFSLLSRKKLSRLMSSLSRARGEVSLDEIDDESRAALQLASAEADPESLLIRREAWERLELALDGLTAKERLVIQIRFEEGMAAKDMAEMLRMSEREVKKSLKAALSKLKRSLK